MRKVMSALWNENAAAFLGGIGVSLATLRIHSLNQTPKVLGKTGRCPGDNEA
jgi:hypothetical protein